MTLWCAVSRAHANEYACVFIYLNLLFYTQLGPDTVTTMLTCEGVMSYLSVSSAHACAWLSVIPSPEIGPNEHQIAIKWWLGLDMYTSLCFGSPDELCQ